MGNVGIAIGNGKAFSVPVAVIALAALVVVLAVYRVYSTQA